MACSKNATISSYQADADRYCQIHSMKYWENIGKLDELNKMNPTDKANALSQAIRASVVSPEMQAVIFDQGQHVKIREFYSFLQKRIPELTHQPFDCPAINSFYLGQ